MPSPIFFSTASEAPAATQIMNILSPIEQSMQLQPMARYCEALDQITIMPICVRSENRDALNARESRYISWKNRYASISLYMDWAVFTAAPPEEQSAMCRRMIRDSLDVIEARCMKKGIPFHKEALLRDILAGS